MALPALILLFLVMLPLEARALEEARFPRPEFTTDYQTPETATPHELPWRNANLSAVLLTLAMSAGIFFLLVRRSYIALRILGLLCLIWFGFVYKGCVCPVGSLQNIAAGLYFSDYQVAGHVLLAFFLPLAVALFFGRIFCGSVCPFGVLQDLTIWRQWRVPGPVDRVLRLVPFLLLGLGVFAVISGFGFMICKYDPFVGFFRMGGPPLIIAAGAILLAVGALFSRPFCRYLCPYSVLLAAASLLSWKRVQVYSEKCINCHLCLPSCPVDAIAPGVDTESGRAFPEAGEKAAARLQWLLALSPFIIAIGFYTGENFARSLLPLQPQIALQALVSAGAKDDDRVVAFYSGDGNLGMLEKNARSAAKRTIAAGKMLGIYMALVFMGAVIAANRRRTNRYHLVEPWNCVACGRCYGWCPGNLEKKNV